MTLDGDAPVGASITSTARKLSDGVVFFEFDDQCEGAVIPMITRFGRWVSAAAIIAVLGVAFSG